MNKEEQNLNNAETLKLGISDVIPRISHLVDKNGRKFKLNKTTLEYLVSIKRDGTLKFIVVIKSTLECIDVVPVYVV